jgi:galactosyl transferase GMA12/MNN10 family
MQKPIALYQLHTYGTGYNKNRILKNRYKYAALFQNVHVFWQYQVVPNTTFVPWQKVKDCKRLRDDYEWIWFLDADAFIMSNRSLDDLLNTTANIIISCDCNTYNTGSFS